MIAEYICIFRIFPKLFNLKMFLSHKRIYPETYTMLL